MSLVLERIAIDLASIRAEAPVRVAPDSLGYGTDLSCVTDLTPALDEVDPFSVRAISEAVVRRHITPRGSLLDDQDYGFDLRAYCNRAVTNDDLRALNGYSRAETVKDDRVSDATVAVVYVGGELSVTIMITAKNPALGVFALVFAVTPDGATLIESIDQRG